MKTSQDIFLTEISDKLAQVLADLSISEFSVSQVLSQISTPPDFILGQAAIPCHLLAKILKKSPVKIAQELADAMNAYEKINISKVEAVNGYLNFHCRFETYGVWLLNQIHSGKYFEFPRKGLSEKDKEKVVVEFSQPNTHKALHVGHLRNMVYGESVCNLLEYAGHRVVRATYPGDLGTHIAKSLWYIQNQMGGTLPDANQADWLGRMYADSSAFISNQSSDKELVTKMEIGKVLQELRAQKGPFYDLYLTTKQWSLDQMGIPGDRGHHSKSSRPGFRDDCGHPSDLIAASFGPRPGMLAAMDRNDTSRS